MRGTAKYLIFLPILLGTILIIISCSKQETPTETQKTETTNHGPVITHLFIDAGAGNPSDSVYVGQEVGLICFAKDEDNDPLTYTWSCKRGTLINLVGGTYKYKAIGFWGKDTAYVVVSDGKQVYTGKIEIYVTPYPSKPSLSFPSSYLEGGFPLSPILYWDSENAESYTFQMSKDSYFNSFIYNESEVKETSKQLSGLEIDAIYYCRLKAKNSYAESSWSYTYSFHTVAPPRSPNPYLPVSNSIDISLSPIFEWNNVYNNDSVKTFCLQVSTSREFNNYVYNQCGLTDRKLQISGFAKATTYFWRVNASNKYGTSSFSKTSSFRTMEDNITEESSCEGIPYVYYEGKKYNTVQIGNQCWLKENLDVGFKILNDQQSSDNNVLEKYCYDNNTANCEKYGGLYQWGEAMAYSSKPGTKGICPEGWHIPTRKAFAVLISSVQNSYELIEKGELSVSNNKSGFTALLAGQKSVYNNNSFSGQKERSTYFWSSTESGNAHILAIVESYVYISNSSYDTGFSIRCIKD